MTMNFELETAVPPMISAVDAKVQVKTTWHISMMQSVKKMYCKHVLFSKWNWFSLIPRKRWVTVAAERIRMNRIALWGYPNFESANICNGFCTTSFITFQYLPISVKRMSKVVAISSVSLMHKPAAFTICAVQCCGRCCAHWPHLCVKGCGWTDRRERLDMAKKGVRLEVSKGWEEIPFDFWGVDLFCRYGEKWNRTKTELNSIFPQCHNGNVRDMHPNFCQEMALTQQYNQQLLQLNQQYHQQKALPTGKRGGCVVKQRECPTKSGSPKTPHWNSRS